MSGDERGGGLKASEIPARYDRTPEDRIATVCKALCDKFEKMGSRPDRADFRDELRKYIHREIWSGRLIERRMHIPATREEEIGVEIQVHERGMPEHMRLFPDG